MVKKILFFLGIAVLVIGRFSVATLFSQETTKGTESNIKIHSMEEAQTVKESLITESDLKKKLTNNARIVAFRAFQKNDTGVCRECGGAQKTEFCWS